MSEKLDTSPEDEAIKNEAREFMTGLVGSGIGDNTAECCTENPTPEGADIIQAWISKYSSDNDGNQQATIMKDFWSIYDPYRTSIWSMTYDEADSNENLQETIDLVTELLHKPEMVNLKQNHDCFGVVHVLEDLSIEGIWLFNGPDPTKMYSANEDTSWYTFTQIGPEANDHVKAAVAKLLMPTDDGKLNGKVIKDTKVFPS